MRRGFRKVRHNRFTYLKKTPAYRRLKWRLYFDQWFRCFYCHRFMLINHPWIPFSREKPWTATFEHKVRVVDGGSDEPDNLVLACKKCNNHKGDWDDRKRYNSMYIAMCKSGIIKE